MSAIQESLQKEKNDFICLHDLLKMLAGEDGCTLQDAAKTLSRMLSSDDKPRPEWQSYCENNGIRSAYMDSSRAEKALGNVVSYGRFIDDDSSMLSSAEHYYGFRASELFPMLRDRRLLPVSMSGMGQQHRPADSGVGMPMLDMEQQLAQAKAECVELRQQLQSLQEQLQNKSIPLLCDPAHEFYSPELHAAVALWEDLYVRGGKRLTHSHTNAVTNWMEKQLGKFVPGYKYVERENMTAVEKRLRAITNPRTTS